jgi:GxxExxY protein
MSDSADDSDNERLRLALALSLSEPHLFDLQRATSDTSGRRIIPLAQKIQRTGTKDAERSEKPERFYREPGEMANTLSFAIIGAAIDVHRELGPGHLESAYENALALELRLRGFAVDTQVPAQVMYRNEVVGQSRIDLIINDWVIVEVKAVERLSTIHTIQALSYLKTTALPLALLLNFNVPVLTRGLRRVVPPR